MAVAHVGGIIGIFRLSPQLFTDKRISPCRGHNRNFEARLFHLLTKLVVNPCRGHNRNFRLGNAGLRRISRKDLELAHVGGIIDTVMPAGTIDRGRTNWNGHDRLGEQFGRRSEYALHTPFRNLEAHVVRTSSADSLMRKVNTPEHRTRIMEEHPRPPLAHVPTRHLESLFDGIPCSLLIGRPPDVLADSTVASQDSIGVGPSPVKQTITAYLERKPGGRPCLASACSLC